MGAELKRLGLLGLCVAALYAAGCSKNGGDASATPPVQSIPTIANPTAKQNFGFKSSKAGTGTGLKIVGTAPQ